MSASIKSFALECNAFRSVMVEFRDRNKADNFCEKKSDGSAKDMRVRLPKRDASGATILPDKTMPVSDEWVSKSYATIKNMATAISNDEAMANTFIQKRIAQTTKPATADTPEVPGTPETICEYFTRVIDPLLTDYAFWTRKHEVAKAELRHTVEQVRKEQSDEWISFNKKDWEALPEEMSDLLFMARRERIVEQTEANAKSEALKTYVDALKSGVKPVAAKVADADALDTTEDDPDAL